jgi:TPR repeat protein
MNSSEDSPASTPPSSTTPYDTATRSTASASEDNVFSPSKDEDEINFQCPHCGQKLSITKDLCGQNFECPTCGKAFKSPDVPEAKTPIQPQTLVKKRRHWLWIVAAVLMITVSVPFIKRKEATPNGESYYQKGLAYANGSDVAQNDTEAIKWYHKAAEQGHAAAKFSLGLMYEEGRGVSQDYAEAEKWYRIAAEKGYAVAQFQLGTMYQDGRGVKQNDAEARIWYRKAAAQDEAYAEKAHQRLKRHVR